MTQAILIGTGTPNPDPYRSGPCVMIEHNDKLYLFDIGVGLVRRVNQAGYDISKLDTAFVTHLHSDHTLGFSDLLITPWILGRSESLKIFGPKGLKHMAKHISAAYEVDIYERIHGLEQANTTGCRCEVTEIQEGLIYDNDIKVYALSVPHGNFESYAFKVVGDKTIVISGDTAPFNGLVPFAKGCDILIHEVYYTKGLETRSPQWQKYHSSVHTSSVELGKLASLIQPKELVLYHQLFMQEHILDDDMTENNKLYKEKILKEVEMYYNGCVTYGEDLMEIR